MTVGRRGRRLAGWILAIGAACAAVDCATVTPASGAREVSQPSAASGAAGWVSGDSSEQSLRSAATSAGVGALAVASVGYQVEVQESKLREQLVGSGVSVVCKGDEVKLSMPGSLAFASDSTDLNTAFGAVLDAVAALLKKYDQTVIEVAGHTDSTGSREHNRALSERRAAAVAAYLEKRGILTSRVATVCGG